MIFTGDINQFALECVTSVDDNTEGEIFIVIENNRYGSKGGAFDLNQFFNNILYALKNYKPDIPELYGMNAQDVFDSLDAVWEDTSADKCPIDKVIDGFFDNPSKVTGEIVFYGGFYAFDSISVVMVASSEKAHLMIRDEHDMRMSHIVIGKDEFEDSFIKLAALYKKNQ